MSWYFIHFVNSRIGCEYVRFNFGATLQNSFQTDRQFWGTQERHGIMKPWGWYGDDVMFTWFIRLFYSILFAFLEDEEEDLDVDVVDDEECKKAEDIHWMKFQ